jgi:hypothetical protein
MAKKKKEELLFTAECTYLDDETKTPQRVGL